MIAVLLVDILIGHAHATLGAGDVALAAGTIAVGARIGALAGRWPGQQPARRRRRSRRRFAVVETGDGEAYLVGVHDIIDE